MPNFNIDLSEYTKRSDLKDSVNKTNQKSVDFIVDPKLQKELNDIADSIKKSNINSQMVEQYKMLNETAKHPDNGIFIRDDKKNYKDRLYPCIPVVDPKNEVMERFESFNDNVNRRFEDLEKKICKTEKSSNLLSFPLSGEEKKLINELKEKFSSMDSKKKSIRFERNDLIKFQPLLDMMVEHRTIEEINPYINGSAHVNIIGNLSIFWTWLDNQEKHAAKEEKLKNPQIGIRILNKIKTIILICFVPIGAGICIEFFNRLIWKS